MRASHWTCTPLIACAIALGLPTGAHAATQVIEGLAAPSPRVLSVFIGDTGSLQAKRGVPVVGQPAEPQPVAGMFFGASTAPAANFWHLRVKGGAANNLTFGPRDTTVTQVSNGPVTGDWTAASPAQVNTVMRIQHNGADLFEVIQRVLYVGPELRYRVVWDIRNISGQAIPFVFGTSADLFIGSDAGEGVFVATAPRFIGGRNKLSGTTGGLEEVTSSQLPGEALATPVAPWASYEEGDPFPVTRRLSSQDAFTNTINPLFMDNGVGVSFADRATTGLPVDATVRYEVIWHLSRATTAAASPVPQEIARVEPPGAGPAEPPPPVADHAAPGVPVVAADPGPGGGAAADTTAPVIRALKLAPSAAGPSAPRLTRTPSISFRLSEAADVVLRVARRTPRRRVTVRSLTRANLPAGSHSARLGGRPLAPGSYVVSARAVDAAGNAGMPRSARFRIRAR